MLVRAGLITRAGRTGRAIVRCGRCQGLHL